MLTCTVGIFNQASLVCFLVKCEEIKLLLIRADSGNLGIRSAQNNLSCMSRSFSMNYFFLFCFALFLFKENNICFYQLVMPFPNTSKSVYFNVDLCMHFMVIFSHFGILGLMCEFCVCVCVSV